MARSSKPTTAPPTAPAITVVDLTDFLEEPAAPNIVGIELGAVVLEAESSSSDLERMV